MKEKEESEKNLSFVSHGNQSKLSNDSNISSLSLNAPPSGIGLESLNLKLESKKFVKPKTKFNILKYNYKNDIEVRSRPPKNPKIKYFQKIIFIPIVLILILIPFILWEKYLINLKNESESTYIKYFIRVFCILIYFCYFLSVFSFSYQTNINKKYKINDDLFKNKKLENIFNKDFWEDYCINCQSQKFIRTNHCDICNKCILLKFKHCFFIANCIGFNNVQYVINFLFWAICGLFNFEHLCSKYFKETHEKINAFIMIDFIINIPLLIYLLYFFGILLFDIYNNQTKFERANNNQLVDKYYMFYKCNDTENKFRFPNYWNIGYLSHFYYIIGPTILHFIFPLPKIKNYDINENCQIFKGCRQFNRLELIQNMIKKSEDYKKNIKDKYIEPDQFIEKCKLMLNSKNIT